MTTFVNQSVGSFDVKDPADHRAHQYVEVWFDQALVKAFKFHSIMAGDVMKDYHRLFGVSVDARHIWEATCAFSCVSNIMAVRPDGSEFYVTWVSLNGGKVEEFRMGDRWGQPIARMTRTGYVQAAQHSAA